MQAFQYAVAIDDVSVTGAILAEAPRYVASVPCAIHLKHVLGAVCHLDKFGVGRVLSGSE
jgi:hypothetical protein